MRINHNISALNAWRSMDQVNQSMGKTLEKLSSGLRINRAGDDAAGLAISEKMRGQIKGLETAVKNAQDSISLIQTAEGALTETHSILQRMRELSVQAATDTNTNIDRNQIQLELDQLRDEIDRISRTTEFNTMKLLDGKIESFRGSEDIRVVTGGNINVGAALASVGAVAQEGTYVVEVGQLEGTVTSSLDVRITQMNDTGIVGTPVVEDLNALATTVGGIKFTWTEAFNIDDFGGSLPLNEVVDSAVVRAEATNTAANQLVFQIGANEGHNIVLGIDDMSAAALGLTNDSLVATDQDSAERSIMVVDAAIHKVSTARASLGAVQNRLEHTISNLGVASENLTAAESRIRDADMAKEMMDFTKQQILLQASNAMLAQANTIPQNVLQLLR
ncbi:MAG: flagellin [Petrotoga sp.]|nr:flagellin [Petrotoga sp.]